MNLTALQRAVVVAASLLLALCSARAGAADEHCRSQTIAPRVEGNFGFSVDYDAGRMIVGAPKYLGSTPNASTAYAYERIDGVWHLEGELLPPSQAGATQYGWSVAISNDYAAVGASSNGSVHVFKRVDGQWIHSSHIEPPQDASGRFGDRLVFKNSTLLISDWLNNTLGKVVGAVYVYKRDGDTWTQQSILYPSFIRPATVFGRTIDYDGHQTIVNGSGRAHIFERKGSVWSKAATIVPSVPPEFSTFNVQIDQDVAVLGSWNDDTFGEDAGAVYVFRRLGGAWLQEAVIHSPAPQADANFGTRIDLRGNVLAVSEALSGEGNDAVAVHLYKRNDSDWELTESLTSTIGHHSSVALGLRLLPDGLASGHPADEGEGEVVVYTHRERTWTQAATLAPADAHDRQYFGWSVSRSGDFVALTRPTVWSSLDPPSAVFVYRKEGGRWNFDAFFEPPASFEDGRVGFVAIDGDVLAFSVRDAGTDPDSHHSVLIYRRVNDDWVLEKTIEPAGLPADSLFGFDLALQSGQLFVGDSRDDEGSTNSGAIYVYDENDGAWDLATKILPPER